MMWNKRIGHLIGRLGIVLALAAGLALATLPESVSATPGTQSQPRLRVMASFSILADIAANVAGDAAEVEVLIPRGTNPHSFDPSARDVVALSDADIVFVVGLNFEENLITVVEEAAGDVRSVSGCVPVRPIVQGVVQHDHDSGEDAHDEEHHMHDPGVDTHACETHHAAIEAAFGLEHVDSAGALGLAAEGACDAGCDPHVWTDPAHAALWALAIRDALSERDPANAEVYAANTAAYLDELAELHHDIATQIDAIPPAQRVIVTNHLAFNYFAARYGLEMVGVVIPGGSTSAEPSVQEVLALIDAIKDAGVPAIFTETTVSDSLARQVADESGARMVQLYTGSLSEADGPAATYLDYMRYNTGQIAAALQ